LWDGGAADSSQGFDVIPGIEDQRLVASTLAADISKCSDTVFSIPRETRSWVRPPIANAPIRLARRASPENRHAARIDWARPLDPAQFGQTAHRPET